MPEWPASGRTQRVQPDELTVTELCARFLRHAVGHYRRPTGTPTGTIYNFKAVMRHLKALYGQTPAAQFGPLALKAVRQRMLEAAWSRNVINQGPMPATTVPNGSPRCRSSITKRSPGLSQGGRRPIAAGGTSGRRSPIGA